MAKKQDSNKEQLQLLKDAQSVAKQMGASEESILRLQQDILAGRLKSYKALQQELSILQDVLIKENERVKSAKILTTVESDLADILNKMSKDSFKMAQTSQKEVDLAKQTLIQKEEELKTLEEMAGIDAERVESVRAQISMTKQLIQSAEKLKSKFSDTNLSLINKGFDELQSKVDKVIGVLPNGLSKALGLDTLAADLKEAALGGTGISSKLIMGGMVAALAGAYAILDDINKQAKEFAAETGLTVAASQQLITQSYVLETSAANQLSSQKDILAVQQELLSTLGPIAQLSGDVALRVSDTGKAFGYGAQEAAKVQAQMMQIAGYNETAAIEAQEFTAQLALAEGVAPGAVMKDIAKSSAISAKYFAGNPKALGAAAVEAAKLGTSLEQMAKTSEAILNIEQSLEDQFVASAMLGRQLNFDAARRAAAEGNIAEATQEVLKQLGGIEEFENASVFAKQRMAAAAGMTVEELSKSLAIEARRGELSEDQLKAMNGLNLSTAEIKNMSAEELKNRVASQQSTEELSQSMDKIASALATTILPIAQMLAPIFSTIATVVGYIVEGFQTLKPILPYILTMIAAIKAETILAAVASAILTAYKTFASMPLVGIALGTAAAIGAVGFIKSQTMDDGEVGPVGPSGYSRVMTGPEGSIAFNDKDTIVAGTNLGGGGGTAIDYDKLGVAVAKAIQNLKIIIDESAVGAINKRGAVAASYNG